VAERRLRALVLPGIHAARDAAWRVLDQVGLFEPGTWRGLNVLDETGRIAGLSTRVGPVQIVRPKKPPGVDALGIEHRLDESVTPSLRCLGSTASTRSAEVGNTVDITLFWQATQRPANSYALQLSLVSEKEAYTLASDLPLGRDEHPSSAWEGGEIVRSPHRVRIPASATAGDYAIEGLVLDEMEAPVAPAIRLGEIEILPTDRLFVVPDDIQHRVDANLEHRVRLLGYDLGLDETRQLRAGGSLPVTLYWQATREMDTSYKVSVQLVGANGVLVQADAVPVAWARPTTGWVTGEVLVDEYTLELPGDVQKGTYRLIVGLYAEDSLRRLSVLDVSGEILGDHVLLSEVEVR
jgi:hypothetical protein